MIGSRPVKRAVLRALNAWDTRHGALAPQSPALWGLETDGSGRLAWDGCPLEDLARRFGTPLHVVSRSRLEANYRGFRDAFAARYPRVEIAYSYKTNPLPGVIRALHECGAAAEVISHFELWLALELGVAPERIIFNGPAKTPAALDLAVRRGIKLINIDGAAEIRQIDERAAHYGRKQRVGVRIVTSVGWSSQFGFSIADGAAMEAFRQIQACRHLEPCALHLHLGSGLHDARIYFQASREAVGFALRLRAELGVAIEHLDLGGGFNVPTVRQLSGLDQKFLDHGFPIRPPRAAETPTPVEFAAGIVSLLEELLPRGDGRLPELILEPGRAITSGAQCLLLSVLALKPGDRRERYAIVDGGKNLTVPLGYEYHELFAAGRMNGTPPGRYTVFGPLCHPHDIVARHRDLPGLEVGDVLAVMDAGAYFIPNQMNFSNPRAAAVMITGGVPKVIRGQETFEDVVRLDGVG
jgi:diaminopimelate decarboxylase